MKNLSVIGIGRLGLCFCLTLERAGYSVVGCDINEDYINNKKIFSIRINHIYFEDIWNNILLIFQFKLKLSFIFGNREITKGNIVKDEIKIIVNAAIITFPKSITGLISENNKEPKATIVVKAVYRHG